MLIPFFLQFLKYSASCFGLKSIRHSFYMFVYTSVGVPVITRLTLNCEDVMIHMHQDFDLEWIYLFYLRRPDPQTARSFYIQILYQRFLSFSI